MENYNLPSPAPTGLGLNQAMLQAKIESLKFEQNPALELMKETFSIMDLLFYGIALYEGYRFSFRRPTREQLMEGAILSNNLQ